MPLLGKGAFLILGLIVSLAYQVDIFEQDYPLIGGTKLLPLETHIFRLLGYLDQLLRRVRTRMVVLSRFHSHL
jgi:hypothetical protein